ncbi:hypothetical protein [Streptomyces californicus]|uniref:hypothetical protein n=1 Tax=Streptomyces californicus TaxID=67351 RepID=UPI00368572D6
MTSLDVQLRDNDYKPQDGLHITYTTGVFTETVDIDQWNQQAGYTIHLRNGGILLAQVELLGSPRDARDTADEISLDTSADWPWFTTLHTLSKALRTDRLASTFTGHLGRMKSWHDTYHVYDEQDQFAHDAALAAKRLLAQHVPADLQAEMPLAEATEEHIRRLRARAVELRVTAVREMPDPTVTPRPNRWIAAYTPQEARRVKDEDRVDPLRPWLADLPHRLLACWGELPENEKRSRAGTSSRDALLTWATEWDLPKTTIQRASGVARTTIDRLLRNR